MQRDRSELAEARDHGLRKRHAQKLQNLAGHLLTHRCRECGEDIPLITFADHHTTHQETA